MKFPLLANAFGHQKLILEIGGNAVGLSEPSFQPQKHRRRRSESAMPAFQQRSQRLSGASLGRGV